MRSLLYSGLLLYYGCGWRKVYVGGGGMNFNWKREGTTRRIPFALESGN
jgi:hypothetical protein